MITIQKKRAGSLAVFVLLLVAFLTMSITPLGFRGEMIVKIMLISFTFFVLPSVDLGRYRVQIVLVGAVAVILTSSLSLDSKTTARAAIAIFLLPTILRVRIGPFLFVTALASLFFLQDLIRSRALEITVLLFILQIVLFRFWAKPVLFYLFPVLYVAGLAVIGFLFIYSDSIVEATASNLARSSIVYTTVNGLQQYPFGYPDQQEYYFNIRPLALNLYSDEYNDPHNFFLSAAVWGGFPLLLLFSVSYYAGIRGLVRGQVPDPSSALAISALVVFMATSTLSFGNVLFVTFLVLFASQYTKSNLR